MPAIFANSDAGLEDSTGSGWDRVKLSSQQSVCCHVLDCGLNQC